MSGITDFHGMEAGPSFDRARQLISTPFQYLDIALDTQGTNQIFNIAGDFLFFDVASTGIATMELNNQYNDPAAPFTVQANFAIAAVFKQIKLSWAAQAGKKLRIMFSTGDRVIPANSGVQSVTISGTPTVLLSGTPQVSQKASDYTATWCQNISLLTNSAVQIVSPSLNVNGMEVINAEGNFYCTGEAMSSLIAKTSAPSTSTDGDVLAISKTIGNYQFKVMELKNKVFVPAGKGLYLISSNAENSAVPWQKAVTYKLL